jgi:hypothetical protein
LLAQIVYIDLANVDEETARKRLIRGVMRDRAKPSGRPTYPSTRTDLKSPSYPSDESKSDS